MRRDDKYEGYEPEVDTVDIKDLLSDVEIRSVTVEYEGGTPHEVQILMPFPERIEWNYVSLTRNDLEILMSYLDDQEGF